ncbi:MAG: hypothetical protein HY655_03015 [Acidobacteria bacterium]|nr:hypothetical protein [Acidobacteriota bacterium]
MQKRGLPSPSSSPKKASQKAARRKKSGGQIARVLKFGLAIAAVGLMGYCASEMSGVAYDDADIRVVDFSSLTASQKRGALREANRARCNCGCGMTLAQCVSTDSTCPVREPNIQRINTIVQNANRP